MTNYGNGVMDNRRARLIAGHEDSGHIKHLKTKITIGLIAAGFFIYLAWHSYSTQVANFDEASLPIIKAPSSPIKVKPDDPGGLKIEHKDKEIYDHMSGKKTRNKEVLVDNRLKPATHEEIKKIVSKQAKSKQATTSDSEVKPVIIQLPQNNISTKKHIRVKTYNLRIAAIKSPKVQDKAWAILTSKYPALKGFKAKITTVKKNGKNIHFLEAGNIVTQAEADKICRSIIEAGGKCKIY